MLAESIKKLVLHFDEQQNALILAIGERLKDIVDDIRKNEVMSHGNPPYIVDTGDVAMLIVEEDGTYSKLAPDFSLSEDNTAQDFSVIYSLPIRGFGMVRFIPVRNGFKAPLEYQSNFFPSAYDSQFLTGLSQYLKIMADAIPELTAAGMAKKLIQLQSTMEVNAEKANMELGEFMQLREVRDAIIEVLGQTLVEAAQRGTEMMIEARKQNK
jgi:hypothetical protein